MEKAPLYNDMARGPDGGEAWWLTASDGVRIRAGYWPGGNKGTILMFPGRTEYVEKYGILASDMLARGYSTISIDWRGQGLADRLDPLPTLGHVDRFFDYQLDVQAVLAAAKAAGAPEPYYLIAHSMGGCIGLRSLHVTDLFRAAVFSAPMWGMSISPLMRPVAWAISWATYNTKFSHHQVPGTQSAAYVLADPFEDNILTTDPDMWAYMQDHMRKVPDLILGGPSVRWLYEALVETRALRAMPAPATPAKTFLGTNERVVDPRPIHRVMDKWANGELIMIEGAEHETPMETPATRTRFYDTADALFSANP